MLTRDTSLAQCPRRWSARTPQHTGGGDEFSPLLRDSLRNGAWARFIFAYFRVEMDFARARVIR